MIVLVLPDIPTEDRLLAQARQGDERAIMAIYDAYFDPVFQLVLAQVLRSFRPPVSS